MNLKDNKVLSKPAILPEEETWPPEVKGIVIQYTDISEKDFRDGDNDIITYIPRSIPTWTPGEGEAVFFIEDNWDYCLVGVIQGDCINSQGYCSYREKCRTKPFSLDKLGYRWDEI